MSVAVITEDNITRDVLKEVLDTAYMNTFVDSDGDVGVRDQCICFLLPNTEQKRLRLLTVWRFKEDTPDTEKVQCANRINSEYVIVRAAAHGHQLQMTYDVSLEGDGITPRSLVLLVKRFCTIALAAAVEHGREILE